MTWVGLPLKALMQDEQWREVGCQPAEQTWEGGEGLDAASGSRGLGQWKILLLFPSARGLGKWRERERGRGFKNLIQNLDAWLPGI